MKNSPLFSRAIPKTGVYTLVMFMPYEKRIEIGGIGVQRFLKGYYAYTGSALGKGSLSLRGRILRHLRKEKKKRWHIDFLSSDNDVNVIFTLAVSTNERMECEINQYLHEKTGADIPILRFGSSDCKRGCGSHLLYFGYDEGIVEKLTRLYEEKVGDELIILKFCGEKPEIL